MTEDDARGWLTDTLNVSRGTLQRLDLFVELLRTETERQNLIAASTFDSIWSRHIVDSAQLLPLADVATMSWIDLGAGAGFPGLIIALLSDFEVTLVDSRRKRIAFLDEVIGALALRPRVTAICSRVELLDPRRFDAISARAFAPLERLLPLGSRFAGSGTKWLLPKGRTALSELEAVRGSWQGAFRIEPSITDPEAAIIVAQGVKPRGRG